MNSHPPSLARLSPILVALLLGACATRSNVRTLEAGPGTDFDAQQVQAYTESQTKVLEQLLVAAGQKDVTLDAGPVDWDRVIDAGMDYADRQCEAYMHALFRLDRDRRTTVAQIGLLGTAAAGLMAAVDAAAKSVSGAAIAFGLAGSSVENLSSNLLYALEPSSVRSLVKGLQTNYRASRGTGWNSRVGAINAIRGYAVLCVPASIEAEVNLSVKKAKPEVTLKAIPAEGRAPVVTNAVVSQVAFDFENDAASGLLDAFAFPGGKLDPNAERRLTQYLEARQIKASVVGFINGAGFAAERARAAKFFGLTP